MKIVYHNRNIKYKRAVNTSCLFFIILMFMSCGSQKSLPEDTVSLEKLIWSRSTDSTLIINKKILKKIYRKTDTDKVRYFNFLDYYSSGLTIKQPRIDKELPISDRAYVVAHVLEYMYKCQKKFKEDDPYKNSKLINRILAPWNANKYNREFKKHDYYGLRLLKKHHLKHFWKYPEQDTIP